jgi:hypothetical protein
VKPENSTADLETDLFGNPLLPMKDPRGRKAYAKSKENQELVLDLRAGGMTHGDIATVLGCDEKTLRKYYSRELNEGAILVQAESIRVLVRKMRMGNMAATKLVLEMASLQNAPAKKPRVDKLEPLGKKALLDKGAADVPQGWGGLLGDGKRVN